MRIIISQPRYLPVMSYLQRLYHADLFVLLDSVQRQGRGWENRNKLLVPDSKWLTVPISSSSRALICNTKIQDSQWITDHISVVKRYYADAKYYDSSLLDMLEKRILETFLESDGDYTRVIRSQLEVLCSYLGFTPQLALATDIEKRGECADYGPEKIRDLCVLAGATEYVSGGNGKAYGIEEAFQDSNIAVRYHHPELIEYAQQNSEFVPFMACLDTFFHLGPDRCVEIVTGDFSVAN
jgi:WbqC-like protein